MYGSDAKWEFYCGQKNEGESVVILRDQLRKSMDLDGSMRNCVEQETLIIDGGELCFNLTLKGDGWQAMIYPYVYVYKTLECSQTINCEENQVSSHQ